MAGPARAADDASVTENTIWGGFDSADQAAIPEESSGNEGTLGCILPTQLVDPGDDHMQIQQMEHQMQRVLSDYPIPQENQDKGQNKDGCVMCGVDFSKRSNQLLCILLSALAVTAVLAGFFVTFFIESQPYVVAMVQTGSNSTDLSSSRP